VGIEAKIFGQAKVLKESLNNQLQEINTNQGNQKAFNGWP
jgi:hypothetical protein